MVRGSAGNTIHVVRYLRGKKHGKGVYRSADGISYDGQFRLRVACKYGNNKPITRWCDSRRKMRRFFLRGKLCVSAVLRAHKYERIEADAPVKPNLLLGASLSNLLGRPAPSPGRSLLRKVGVFNIPKTTQSASLWPPHAFS